MKKSPTGNNILNPIERAVFHRLGGRCVKGAIPNKPVHREPKAKPASATGGFKLTKTSKHK